MENKETINSETIEENVQSETTTTEAEQETLQEEAAEVQESEKESVETGNESAQTNETLIDYTESLTMIYSEIQSLNYLLSVVVFLELFIWVEDKVKHIVRSMSNKWKN